MCTCLFIPTSHWIFHVIWHVLRLCRYLMQASRGLTTPRPWWWWTGNFQGLLSMRMRVTSSLSMSQTLLHHPSQSTGEKALTYIGSLRFSITLLSVLWLSAAYNCMLLNSRSQECSAPLWVSEEDPQVRDISKLGHWYLIYSSAYTRLAKPSVVRVWRAH